MTESFRPTLLRAKGWEALKGKWNMGALAAFIVMLLVGATGAIPIAGSVAGLLFGNILVIGLLFLFWDVLKGGEVKFDTLFEGFRDYARYLVGSLLVSVYTLLWMLLLIVPGIIKGISYSMTYFILRENPTMSGEQAIQRSMAMMEGHKMDYFLLSLSFIGWMLLGMLALGIGLFWVLPYVYTTNAAFYEELKKDYEARQAFAQA